MSAFTKLIAGRLRTQVSGPHPDAEVLSAFAENALPAEERETVLQHLSGCSDCRNIIFLAAPSAVEVQHVVWAPKARPHFALRWGTLAACIVIAAIFLVSRRQTSRTEQFVKSAHQTAIPAVTPPAATDTIVAAEKTPAEFSQLHDKLPAPDKVPTKVAAPYAGTGHAEPKHITARPEGSMAFGDSGEVQLKEPAALPDRVEPHAVQELPMVGRNAAELKQQASTAPAPSNIGGPVTVSRAGGATGGNADWSIQTENAPAKKDLVAYGYVAGTMFDPSGAVIPNVKVTASSPSGTQTATSDQAGRYTLNQLKAGNYQLNFDAPGFQKVQLQQVAVQANQAANMNVKLEPGTATETVTVEAAAVPLNAQSGNALQVQQQNVNGLQAGVPTQELSRSQTGEVARKKKRGARSAPTPVSALAKAVTSPVWQWSLSPQGLVQRSFDKGVSWQVVPIAQGLVARAISSIANHVWVGGDAASLYHSADSGQHWTRVIPATSEGMLRGDITQIQFADPDHGTVTTSIPEVWITSDGGRSWIRQ